MATIVSSVRGVRNANPGNLRRNNTKWQGLRPVQTDPDFFQFKSMIWGVRALAMTLITYRNKYHLVTVQGIVNRYAPSHENDTLSYIANVSKAVGAAPDARIDTAHTDVMFVLVRAIIRQELGLVASQFISDDTVHSGIALAPDAQRTMS